MAELVIPPGFAQARFLYRLTADPEEMCITLGVEVPDGFEDPSVLASRLYNDAKTSISGAAEMYPTWTFTRVVEYVGQDGGPPTIGEYGENLVGTRTVAAQPPNNCAVLVRKLSAVGGRRNKGRFYFPPMSLGETAVNENGVIAGATLTGLQANFTEFYGLLTSPPEAQCNPVILHSEAPTEPTPITAFVVQAQIATPRTRMRK